MRDISTAMAAHLTEGVTTLALCWRIARTDGVIQGFTAHDRDLTVEGETYRAAPSIAPTAIAVGAQGGANAAMEVGGVLSHGAITAVDLQLGRYDHAQILVFLANWAEPAQGRIVLAGGTLGDIRLEDTAFRADVASLSAALDLPIIPVYSPECRADLGDRACAVDLAGLTVATQVQTVVSVTTLTATGLSATVDFYAYGRLRWLSGTNVGFDGEVLSSTATQLVLKTPPPRAMAVGDRFEVRAGCDKRFATCQTKFANARNFQGEPHVPGTDALVNYPGL